MNSKSSLIRSSLVQNDEGFSPPKRLIDNSPGSQRLSTKKSRDSHGSHSTSRRTSVDKKNKIKTKESSVQSPDLNATSTLNSGRKRFEIRIPQSTGVENEVENLGLDSEKKTNTSRHDIVPGLSNNNLLDVEQFIPQTVLENREASI